MNGPHPLSRVGVESLAAATPNVLVGGTDIEHLLLVRVSQPKDLVDVLRQQSESLFALPHGLFGDAALGDVHAHAAVASEAATRIKLGFTADRGPASRTV